MKLIVGRVPDAERKTDMLGTADDRTTMFKDRFV